MTKYMAANLALKSSNCYYACHHHVDLVLFFQFHLSCLLPYISWLFVILWNVYFSHVYLVLPTYSIASLSRRPYLTVLTSLSQTLPISEGLSLCLQCPDSSNSLWSLMHPVCNFIKIFSFLYSNNWFALVSSSLD